MLYYGVARVKLLHTVSEKVYGPRRSKNKYFRKVLLLSYNFLTTDSAVHCSKTGSPDGPQKMADLNAEKLTNCLYILSFSVPYDKDRDALPWPRLCYKLIT